VGLSRVSDELLARYAALGGERALTALYERYHQPLYRYCHSILRTDADAQDALQATFAGALSALRRGRRNAPLRPWLFRIAHNEAVSILRHRRRERERTDWDGPAAATSAEERVAERARWATLVADIGGLPERQRSALVLRELSGLSHEEIAVALQTSVGGAKQAIFEARQALSALEEGRAMSCEEIRRRLSDGDRRVVRGRRVAAHLRACSGCAGFATAMSARRAELRAFVPALPTAVGTALLARSIHAGSIHGGGQAAATAGATGGAAAGGALTGGAAAGTGASIGTTVAATAIATKAVVALVVVASAAVGLTRLSGGLSGHHATAGGAASHTYHRGVASGGAAARSGAVPHPGVAGARAPSWRAAAGSPGTFGLAANPQGASAKRNHAPVGLGPGEARRAGGGSSGAGSASAGAAVSGRQSTGRQHQPPPVSSASSGAPTEPTQGGGHGASGGGSSGSHGSGGSGGGGNSGGQQLSVTPGGNSGAHTPGGVTGSRHTQQ
jgi:RNA polymerase sigma factor (sigma-70 family)